MKIAVILLGKLFSEATTGDALSKKGVLKNFAKFTGKYLCQGLFFNNVNFIKKETLAQLLSCKFCEISKNAFSYTTPSVVVSALLSNLLITK